MHNISSKHAGHVMHGLKKHRFAKGGPAGDPHADRDVKPYNAQGSGVEKEAKEKKKGGRVHKAHGGMVVEGNAPKMNLGRPGRKLGGRTGSDKSPLTSAAKTVGPVDHETND
jgi:hypothetical protein